MAGQGDQKTMKKSYNRKLTVSDVIIMAVITAIAAAMCFIGLGVSSKEIPTTGYAVRELNVDGSTLRKDYAVFSKTSNREISEIWAYFTYTGGQSAGVTIYVSADGEDYANSKAIYAGGVGPGVSSYQKWVKANISVDPIYRNAPYITLSFQSATVQLSEIAVVDENGQQIQLYFESGLHQDGNYNALIDEQNLFRTPLLPVSSLTSYEVPLVGAASELISGGTIYEYRVPLLARSIESLGILVFGMNPLGWRFMSALFSTLLAPCVYLLAKRIFRKKRSAAFTAALLLFSGLFMNLGRVANSEVFALFFAMLATYFTVITIEKKQPAKEWKQFGADALPLLIAGVCLALSFSVNIFIGGVVSLLCAALAGISIFKKYVRNANGKMMSLEIGLSAVATLVLPFLAYFIFATAFSGNTFAYYEGARPNYAQSVFYPFAQTLAAMFVDGGYQYPAVWLTGIFGDRIFSFADGINTVSVIVRALPTLVLLSLTALIFFLCYLFFTGIKRTLYDGADAEKYQKRTGRILTVLLVGFFICFLPWLAAYRGAATANFYPALIFFIMLLVLFMEHTENLFGHKLFSVSGREITVGMTVNIGILLAIAITFFAMLPYYVGLAI